MSTSVYMPVSKKVAAYDVSHDVMPSFTSYSSSKHWPPISHIKRKGESHYSDQLDIRDRVNGFLLVAYSSYSKSL